MWMKLLTAGALAAALGIAPVAAQDDPSGQQEPAAAAANTEQQSPAASDSNMPEAQSAEMRDLTGWSIYSSDGEKLGDVTKVEKSADGDIRAVYTDIGGFLGLGAKTVEINADNFSIGDNRVDLTMSAEEAKELPEVAEQ